MRMGVRVRARAAALREVSFGMRPGGGAGGVRNGLARSGARIGRPYAGGAGVSASSRAPVVRPPPLGDDCGQWSAMGVPMHGHGAPEHSREGGDGRWR